MTPADTALALLRESRDGEPARIWHDGGRTIEGLARDAGVRVEYVHVNLSALMCEHRTIEGGEHAESFLQYQPL